jgi:hypothetical protein
MVRMKGASLACVASMAGAFVVSSGVIMRGRVSKQTL